METAGNTVNETVPPLILGARYRRALVLVKLMVFTGLWSSSSRGSEIW